MNPGNIRNGYPYNSGSSNKLVFPDATQGNRPNRPSCPVAGPSRNRTYEKRFNREENENFANPGSSLQNGSNYLPRDGIRNVIVGDPRNQINRDNNMQAGPSSRANSANFPSSNFNRQRNVNCRQNDFAPRNNVSRTSAGRSQNGIRELPQSTTDPVDLLSGFLENLQKKRKMKRREIDGRSRKIPKLDLDINAENVKSLSSLFPEITISTEGFSSSSEEEHDNYPVQDRSMRTGRAHGKPTNPLMRREVVIFRDIMRGIMQRYSPDLMGIRDEQLMAVFDDVLRQTGKGVEVDFNRVVFIMYEAFKGDGVFRCRI